MENKELILKCVDCGGNFTLADGEIEFYKARGWSWPKRCPFCRKRRREMLESDQAVRQ